MNHFKQLTIFSFGIFVFCVGTSKTFSQQSAGSTADLVVGTVLPPGTNHFADPIALHGFALQFQGGVGSSTKINGFGYDGFNSSLYYGLGENMLGRRLALSLGVANWFVDAPSTIYPQEALSGSEKTQGADIKTAGTVGATVSLFANRTLSSVTSEITEYLKLHPNDKNKYDKAIIDAQAISEEKRRQAYKELAEYFWFNVIRPTLRKFDIILGANVKANVFDKEFNAMVTDLYVVACGGYGIFDAALSWHHLGVAEENAMYGDKANSVSCGVYLDLSNKPAPPVLGICYSYADYSYKIKHYTIANTDYISSPRLFRNDLLVSATIAPTGAANNMGSIGFKLSWLKKPFQEASFHLALLFSTDFQLTN